jgi:hypothetical protein
MYDACVTLFPLIKRFGFPKLGIKGGLLLITLSRCLLWLSVSVVELRIYVWAEWSRVFCSSLAAFTVKGLLLSIGVDSI